MGQFPLSLPYYYYYRHADVDKPKELFIVAGTLLTLTRHNLVEQHSTAQH